MSPFTLNIICAAFLALISIPFFSKKKDKRPDAIIECEVDFKVMIKVINETDNHFQLLSLSDAMQQLRDKHKARVSDDVVKTNALKMYDAFGKKWNSLNTNANLSTV